MSKQRPYGVPRNPNGRPRTLTGMDETWLRERWQCYRVAVFADVLGVSVSTIWKTARRLGLPSRPKPGRPARLLPAVVETAA